MAATGTRSSWSQATTLDLLASLHWTNGQFALAVQELQDSERQAKQAGATVAADRSCAARMVLLAAQSTRSDHASTSVRFPSATAQSISAPANTLTQGPIDDETSRLFAIESVFMMCAEGNLSEARIAAAAIRPPDRATRSTVFASALQVALLPDRASCIKTVDRGG
jgi:hypothetical protein